MYWKDFNEKRWELFLQIINKQDLDLKGENIKDYHSNFKSAFAKADNIVRWYGEHVPVESYIGGMKEIDRNED